MKLCLVFREGDVFFSIFQVKMGINSCLAGEFADKLETKAHCGGIRVVVLIPTLRYRELKLRDRVTKKICNDNFLLDRFILCI